MFCSKCGIICEDGIVFCPACGNKIEGNNGTSISEVKTGGSQESTKSFTKTISKKPILAVFISLLVITVVASFVVGTNSINKSPEKLAKTFVEAVNELDAKKIVACYPDFIIKEIAEANNLEGSSRKEVEKILKERAEGEQKRKVKVISVLTDRELSTNYDVFDMYNLSENEKSKISQVVDLEVQYKFDGDDNIDNMEIICFKSGNMWYVLDVD